MLFSLWIWFSNIWKIKKYQENYYKSIGAYYSKSNGKPGDLCIMDFGKGRASHIGIVEKKNSNGVKPVVKEL